MEDLMGWPENKTVGVADQIVICLKFRRTSVDCEGTARRESWFNESIESGRRLGFDNDREVSEIKGSTISHRYATGSHKSGSPFNTFE
jgi:hypothetical protein